MILLVLAEAVQTAGGAATSPAPADASAGRPPVPGSVAATSAPRPGTSPTSVPASQPAARYRCDAPRYVLTNVWSGDKVDHAFVIHNDGTAALAITRLEAACGCFVAEDYPRQIPPGGEGVIQVSLRTARAAKEVRKTMEVHTNDPDHPRNTLIIEGPLTPRIEVDPLFGANWGRLAPDDALAKTVKLTNHFTRPMKLEIKPTDTHPEYSAVIKETRPGKTAELTVTAKEGLAEGAHMGQVWLTTGFEEEPELMVPCSMFVPPQFEAIPVAFSVFNRAPDVDIQTLMLRWNGKSPIKIESATCSRPDVKTELSPKEPGRVYYLVVTLPQEPAPPATQTAPAGDAGGPQASSQSSPAPADKPAVELHVVLKTDSKERPEIRVPVRPRTLPKAAASRPG